MIFVMKKHGPSLLSEAAENALMSATNAVITIMDAPKEIMSPICAFPTSSTSLLQKKTITGVATAIPR